MTEIEQEMMASSSAINTELLMSAKCTTWRAEIARCDKIANLLLKLASVEMTNEERKAFSLSLVGPNQRRLGKALASLHFWEDKERVELWIASKNGAA